MSIPQVTFPLEQAQVKPTCEMLLRHLQGLQADTRITHELLRVIRTSCEHPTKKNSRCPDSGEDWNND